MKSRSHDNGTALPPPEVSFKIKSLIYFVLTITIFVIYWQTLNHDFTNYDDDLYVTANQHIQDGFTLKSITWAFTSTYASNWHPLTSLSHMLDFRLYDLDPGGHHLTNMLFHVINALLLFTILSKMTGALWQSGFVAVMFAVHPLNVESVAWISERKNLLSSFFWLLTMWAYLRYTTKATIGKYLIALVLFTLGLMAKPMLVTLPFVLLMLDFWPLKRLRTSNKNEGLEEKNKLTQTKDLSHLILEKIPFLVITIASCIVTFSAQKGGGGLQSTEIFPFKARLINALVSYIEYLEKIIWPKSLVVLYPHPGSTLAIWKGVVCAIALIIVSTIAIKMIKKAPYFAVGWFWYLGTMIPVIGIIQVGVQSMADRYAYIPLIGIFIAVGWGLPELLQRYRWKKIALTLAMGIIIPALTFTAWTQAGHWKDSITLFKHNVNNVYTELPGLTYAHLNLGHALGELNKVDESIIHFKEAIRLNPKHVEAYNNLGIALSKKGELDAARANFKIALKFKPNHAPAYNNLGMILTQMNDYDQAIFNFKEAIKLQSNFAIAHNNLGNALRHKKNYKEAAIHYKEAIKYKHDFEEPFSNLGNILIRQRKFDEATSYLNKALMINPQNAYTRYNLGLAFQNQGHFNEAQTEFQKVIKLKPKFAKAYNGIGEIQLAARKPKDAINYFNNAIISDPTNAKANNNLGIAFLIIGKAKEAISPLTQAIKLNPNNANAHHSLGIALSMVGKAKDGIIHFRDAIRLQPNYAEAHYNLGKALLQLKQKDEAIKHYREAIRIKPDYDLAINQLEAILKSN
ncbi:MAG: tetratricopeptide repeat protein [Nitrospinales bacterium]